MTENMPLQVLGVQVFYVVGVCRCGKPLEKRVSSIGSLALQMRIADLELVLGAGW